MTKIPFPEPPPGEYGTVEDTYLFFARTWAESVLRQLHQLRAMRRRHEGNDRAYDRMEEWSPTAGDLQADFREDWAATHLLVVAANQAELWVRKLREIRGQTVPPKKAVLVNLRDALEHLKDAEFAEGDAIAGTAGNKSLRALPGSRLPIAFGVGDDSVFGLVTVAELERAALDVVGQIEDELTQAAEDWYGELMEEDRRAVSGDTAGEA